MQAALDKVAAVYKLANKEAVQKRLKRMEPHIEQARASLNLPKVEVGKKVAGAAGPSGDDDVEYEDDEAGASASYKAPVAQMVPPGGNA